MDIERINGIEGLKSLFEKTLNNKDNNLCTVLSGKPLIYLIDDSFADYYMKERVSKEIFLRSLRFSSGNLDKLKHKDYSKLNKEVRIAPKEIQINESMVIWDDNVALFNSNTETGILIKNKEHAHSMKSWFDYVWDKSS